MFWFFLFCFGPTVFWTVWFGLLDLPPMGWVPLLSSSLSFMSAVIYALALSAKEVSVEESPNPDEPTDDGEPLPIPYEAEDKGLLAA